MTFVWEQDAAFSGLPVTWPPDVNIVLPPSAMQAVKSGLSGGGTQRPSAQTSPPSHVPHVPPQPSGPHSRSAQAGMHSHTPASHASFAAHVPHVPPQPSGPHSRSAQLGVQMGWHAPSTHSSFAPHAGSHSRSPPIANRSASRQTSPSAHVPHEPP